ncbi:HD domain-containing protein [Ruminiclostridium herbifermentans]|uniref:HD domain-containing protein n=1 Tax=Ruminiclostridium herbifermentans TaxID=2488810 RepID=A0A4U7J5K8_9FIRM|nr:HD domain-containing protein [Ruminiclostridium herbifermentans]QNU67305.1 HD domain-containing protein [Ruminiclostridium herbifermentans]
MVTKIEANVDENIYSSFLERINDIVKEYLSVHAGTDYHQFSEDKVINDPIWGCVKFNSWEIAIIDTPLFQRLRDIYQVGLGVFTYPAARHSRFEHSLGVVAIASRMIESLRNQKLGFINISDYEVMDVRLAALLHDIGHCFYSHLSEAFYGTLPEFIMLQKYFNKKFGVKPKPHEIFSYIIINTDAFKAFLTHNSILNSQYISASGTINDLMVRIGNMIIGVPNYGRRSEGKHGKKYSFLTRIINGDIDADKLDYIKRDSYTSGLPLTFDIERLLYKITIREPENTNEYQLVVDIAGITAVEEITFSKLMLNNYIYHHQKVLATEVMAKDIALALMELNIVKHPCDFLWYTDKTIEALVEDSRIPFNKYNCTHDLGFFVRRVKNRYLPKRCFEINSRVLEPDCTEIQKQEYEKEYIEKCINELESEQDRNKKAEILLNFATDLFEFTDIQKNYIAQYKSFIANFSKKNYKEYTEWIRKDIYECILDLYKKLNCQFPVSGISLFDIHVVVPKSIDEQMIFATPIIYRNSQEQTPTDMLSYTKNWAQAFNSNKWSGYVFVSPHIDVTIAFKATLKVLENHIKGIKFTSPDYYVKRLSDDMMQRIDGLS